MTTVGTDLLGTILNIVSDRDAQFGKLNLSQIICSYKLDLPFRTGLKGNYNHYVIKPFMGFQLILLTPKFLCTNFLPLAELKV